MTILVYQDVFFSHIESTYDPTTVRYHEKYKVTFHLSDTRMSVRLAERHI